jgi:Ca2+-binding EF-hand superfamily protein
MFKTADLDKDGLVSEDEFYNIITRRTKYGN